MGIALWSASVCKFFADQPLVDTVLLSLGALQLSGYRGRGGGGGGAKEDLLRTFL